MVNEITGRDLPIEELVDSRTVLKVIEKMGKNETQFTDLNMRAEGVILPWRIDSPHLDTWKLNPSDVFTKISQKTTSPLHELMRNSHINLTPIGWASVSSKEKSVGVFKKI